MHPLNETAGVIILKSPQLLMSFTGPSLHLVGTYHLSFHLSSPSVFLFPIYLYQVPDKSSWVLWIDEQFGTLED